MGLNFVNMTDEIEVLYGIETDVEPLRSIKPELHGRKAILIPPPYIYCIKLVHCKNKTPLPGGC